MAPTCERAPPGGDALENPSCLAADDFEIHPKLPATQTQNPEVDSEILCWLLVENINKHTESLICQLDAALAMGKAGSAPGFLHGLRRAREIWNAIRNWPNHFRDAPPMEPTPEVLAWIRSRQIAFAKVRGRYGRLPKAKPVEAKPIDTEVV